MVRKYYLLLFLAGILFNCARKTVPTAVTEDYYEDLSGTLPEIEEYTTPVEETPEEVVRAEFRQPVLDITDGLNIVLDSIAAINKNLPYLRYTVMVHNSSSRHDAEEARKDVFRVMPDAKPILQFISPSYIVKVGDFFDQLEAYQTLVKLKGQFPNAVIIPEQVYIE
jgi:hypothetical protein